MQVLTRFRILAALIAAAALTTACGSVTPITPDQSTVQFQTIDLVAGTGAGAGPGNTATVTYEAWLYDETATDHKGAVADPGGTFSFMLGAGQVIPGFEQAVTGMAVGGTRRAIIPPSLAYGASGNGTIPPNAALVFDIQLIGIQ
ncbi:MAG TPA: FKBP-type peptidyl-prolyl cis-trans isomerase [Vicinamibacterales bacterium]|jgi:FKBP-type peptidyl-prolyl cis-trans isomerase